MSPELTDEERFLLDLFGRRPPQRRSGPVRGEERRFAAKAARTNAYGLSPVQREALAARPRKWPGEPTRPAPSGFWDRPMTQRTAAAILLAEVVTLAVVIWLDLRGGP